MPGPPQGPFATPAFRPFIHKWAGFWIFFFFVAIFRLSDTVYLASMQQIVGATSLLAEDVEMIAYSSFIGMTMIFPMLFRLKFRFTTKGILTFVTLSLVVLNIAITHTTFIPILVAIGFVSGALRIWGMFECMSSIMQGITPQRDFAIFFPVIYFMILGFIQITGFVDTYITYHFSWQMMNYADIGLLLTVCLIVQVLMRHFRFGPPMPLYGVDWLGGVLWACVLLLLTFIFTYGEYLDWFYSLYIRFAAAAALLVLAIVLGRMLHIRHPYLEYRTFRYPNVFNMLLLFLLMCLILETQTELQNRFTSAVLHFDAINTVSLNIPTLFGVAVGAYFSCKALTYLNWSYKMLTFTGFLFLVYYMAAMYFLIDPDTSIEKLYLPSFFRGFGNILIYVGVTVYAQKVIPFQHFFQGLCILGMVRTGIANPIGGALFTRWFKYAMIKHTELLGSDVNPIALSTQARNTAVDMLNQQAMLVSLKEIFGYCVIIGIATLLIILASRYKGEIHYLVPTDWQVYRRLQKWNTKLQKKPAKT